MPVDIELFGQLAPGRTRRQSLTLDRPMNALQVAILLDLNPDEIGLIAIDGVQSELEDPVPLNCRLCFFPPVSGG